MKSDERRIAQPVGTLAAKAYALAVDKVPLRRLSAEEIRKIARIPAARRPVDFASARQTTGTAAFTFAVAVLALFMVLPAAFGSRATSLSEVSARAYRNGAFDRGAAVFSSVASRLRLGD